MIGMNVGYYIDMCITETRKDLRKGDKCSLYSNGRGPVWYEM